MEKHNSNAGLFASVGLISAGLLAVLATPSELKTGLFWFGVLWVLLFALTLLAQDTEGDAEKISGVITEKDNLRLYNYLTGKILAFLARVMAPATA